MSLEVLVEPKKRMVYWSDLATLMGQEYRIVLKWKRAGAPEVEGKTCVEWVQNWLDERAAVKTSSSK